MFTDFINRILETEEVSVSNRQVYATPDVIEKSSIPSKPIPSKYEKDIEALKGKYGKGLFSSTGLCIISMTLQEALSIMPRERRRIDAYRGLVSYLEKNWGIELKITSQKTKEEEK